MYNNLLGFLFCFVSIHHNCCAYPEPLNEGKYFADGLITDMADVPDNAPERECFTDLFTMC